MNHRPTLVPAPPRGRARLLLVAVCTVAALAACGKGTQGGPAGPPAMPVEVVTLVTRPVEQTTEFVGTVKSRRSTTVQPQVEGFVTRILVRSGDSEQWFGRVTAAGAKIGTDFRITNAAERLAQTGDRWADALERKQNLEKALGGAKG